MKKIAKNIFSLCLIASAGFIISSCGKEFLEYDPVGAENSASFYVNMGQAEQAVAAAYSTFNTRTCWDRDVMLYLGEFPSDDALAGGSTENELPLVEAFNYITVLPTNITLETTYGNLFRGIYFANQAMENLPTVLENDPKADEAIITQRNAELKFVRAVNYLYLTHIFGQVPLVDHVLGPEENVLDKTTVGAIFDLIEQDLKDAIAVLPERSERSSADVGRATKGAAKAFLARMYLFESSYATNFPGDERFGEIEVRWQDVRDLCREIIDSDEYSLVGIDGETFNTWWGPETNGYRYLFTLEGENNPESIFSIQYINDNELYSESRAGSLAQWTSSRFVTQPRADDSTKYDEVPTGYWGLCFPTQNHVDEYEDGDIRLHTSVAMPGDSIRFKSNDLLMPIYFGDTQTGYYTRKYELHTDQFGLALGHEWHKSPQNVYLIRYADVVLMAAEAAIMLNIPADARVYINMIRERARMCGDGVVPADLTGNITLDQLISERRKELAFEGRRYFDMVRWGIAEERLDGTFTPLAFERIYSSPKNDFQPLPQREIVASNGKLTQHKGW